jgi:hypothetical protein
VDDFHGGVHKGVLIRLCISVISDHMIKCFEELHENYNCTINQIHFLSFSTDLSSNKVFTYKEAMTQKDAHLFFEDMQKEVADHGLQKSLDYSPLLN